MLGKATLVVALALLATVVFTSPAYAERELVSQRVTEITGAEILQSTLSDIRRVQIGSSVTTVTLRGDTSAEPLIVDYSGLLGGGAGSSGAGGGSAVGSLLALSVGAVALRSVLGLLRGVGRLGSAFRRN